MGKEKTFQINDTYRSLGEQILQLQAWESPYCNKEAKENILRHLKEAQLWSLLLVKETASYEYSEG